MPPGRRLLLVALSLLLLVACFSSPGATSPPQFDPQRALAHVTVLAEEIAPRLPGSEAEERAARYILDELAGYGYEAELDSFTFRAFLDAGTTLEVLYPRQRSLRGRAVGGSIGGQVEGGLVFAGAGGPQDFPPETAGRIVLMRRGGIPLWEKAAHAAEAGAAAALIFNDEPGFFLGHLGKPAAIPVASISQEDGLALLSLLQGGPVGVRLAVRVSSGLQESQNVVARPPGGRCRVMVGAHYDSVAAGPGANDNASGTATVLEIARVLAADGYSEGVCFTLFGAEEAGLIGSIHFVSSLSQDERASLRAMLNFDMVGVGSRWYLVGSPGLRDLVAEEAERQGLAYEVLDRARLGLDSDHTSFIQAGIPAVFLHRLEDPDYHGSGDVAANVQPGRLAEIGRVGLAAVDSLLRGR